MNAEAASWNRVIERLDEAAMADGGGLITAGAALARAPARSFLWFVQGAVGTASMADPAVRTQLSEGLGRVMDDPGLIPAALGRYYNTHTAGEIAADAYVGATGAWMGGGAGAAALGRLNKLPVLGADAGELLTTARAAALPRRPVWVLGPDVPCRMGQSGAVNVNGYWIETVTDAQRWAFRDNGLLDPFTNRVVAAPGNRPIQVDHIFPVKKIIELPGFRSLTRAQMTDILQDQIGIGNLQPLPSHLNASKGARVDGAWSAYRGQTLDAGYIKKIANLQLDIEEQIRRQIELFGRINKMEKK